MKAFRLAVLPLAGVFLIACGDSGSSSAGITGGDGGTGGAGSAAGAGGTGAVMTTTTTSTTAGTGGSLAGCPGAKTFDFGGTIEGDLAMTGQEDHYRFDGTKGQVLWIDIDAQVLEKMSVDPTKIIDSVVTLFDANEKQVAENNAPVEFSTLDSRLYTILPADGPYCLRVAECWTVKSNPGSSCQKPKDKDRTAYELRVFELVDDAPGGSLVSDPEAGNDAASAAPVEFAPGPAGGFFTSYMWGYYETEADVDVYSLMLPAELQVPQGRRASAYMWSFPFGPTASGSTVATGELTIVDPDSPDIPLARLDPGNSLRLRAPLALDKEYLLFVNRPSGKLGENDFYLLSTSPGWGNPLEMDDITNNDMATAELIAASPDDPADAYVEGDVLPIADVDHFRVMVPAGMSTVSGVCGARIDGSGLRQMKLSLFGEDGMLLSATSTATETATQSAFVKAVPVGNNAAIAFKVEAPEQAADVAGAYYQCGIHFK